MPWLPQAVESVERERHSVDLQHIILDGGSSDGTREWLEDHRDSGYEVIFESDRGQTDALIKGFDRASGDALGWLNADDALEAGSLLTAGKVLEENSEVVLVCGCCYLIDANDAIVGLIPTPPVPSYEGLINNPLNPAQPATFFRADAYRLVGGLDRRFDLAMDVDLWLRLAKVGDVHFLRNSTLARFRVHPAAKSARWQSQATRQEFAIRRAHGLRLRSETGLWFARQGYLAPMVRPISRRVARAIKALLVR